MWSRASASPPARALLGDYRGILQCDGYAGYKGLADAATGPGPAVVAFCWGNAGRQFDSLAQIHSDTSPTCSPASSKDGSRAASMS